MGPWGGRARGPRAPSAPYGQGTKGPMGPLGVIPRSFRVGGYFEWVVILSVTVRGNAFIAQQNRLSATARVFVTSPLAEILKPIALRFSLDFIPNHFPNLKIFHFVTKCS